MFPLKYSTTIVKAKFKSDNGNNPFQPRFINWSYRNLGMVQRIHMNTEIKINVLVKYAPKPMSVINQCPSCKPSAL